MVKIEGKYALEKNENYDEYLKAVGMPWIARKMVCATSPSLEITCINDEWQITTSSISKNVVKFKLGEEYEESMPGGVIKCTTILEDDKFITECIGPNDTKFSKIHVFTEDSCTIILKHGSGIEAKRYFKRIQ